jgi:hypothetical protein
MSSGWGAFLDVKDYRLLIYFDEIKGVKLEGLRCKRKELTKSASLVTTTYPSRTDSSLITESGVRLPSGKSSV